jgi:hypothetical protein
MSPENLLKQNVLTVYLGYMRTGSQTLSWLGSLELLKNGNRFLGLLGWIEDSLGASARVSVSGTESGFVMPSGFDMLIMNPPYSRATGRTKNFEEGCSAFFGFIPDKYAREIVKKSYDLIREELRQQILNIASSEKELPTFAKKIVGKEDRDLEQYAAIGQAGESVLFLYLAYKYIKQGGTIAFVLNKNVLAGITWFVGRILLASKFQLKYVIVSNDPKGSNFSESTSIGEALIVAKESKIIS